MIILEVKSFTISKTGRNKDTDTGSVWCLREKQHDCLQMYHDINRQLNDFKKQEFPKDNSIFLPVLNDEQLNRFKGEINIGLYR